MSFSLPKDAVKRVNIGHSFAEYDEQLKNPYVFVKTPATMSAVDRSRGHCFFVGRRGTGKTATSLIATSTFGKNSEVILPQFFSALGAALNPASLRDTRQRPFKSLVTAFKRSILDEAYSVWERNGIFRYSEYDSTLSKEKQYIEDFDFEERCAHFIDDIFEVSRDHQIKEWSRRLHRVQDLENAAVENIDGGDVVTILIDRLDESWDGSEKSVVVLMALMHACVELNASEAPIRVLLFLRENIFARVRDADNEFARIETWIVSLEWSREDLIELVERRLVQNFTAKPQLHGPTWDLFFEPWDGNPSWQYILDFCLARPRDVLTFCSFAVQSAQAHHHTRILVEDVQFARQQFSDSRLKDLGDEYAENFPQIQLVLARFHGLGYRFSMTGIEDLIKKLIVDSEIARHCKWVYAVTSPAQFIELFYNIGFFGVTNGGQSTYRSSGASGSAFPVLSQSSEVVVHPSYRDALGLQPIVVTRLAADLRLQTEGLKLDLPENIGIDEYTERLNTMRDEFGRLPTGSEHSAIFEELVGDLVKFCFYNVLTNVQPHARTVGNTEVRDWIASNRAEIASGNGSGISSTPVK